MAKRIVITGAPASGKTIFIERLKNEPGFEMFVFMDELARKLLADNPEYRNNWMQFHRDIYHQQVKREELINDQSFITDRGTVDAFAFHPETMADVGTDLQREYSRYEAVVHLGSSAKLGENYYQGDNIRLENIEEAMAIEARIKNVWSRHDGYHFIKARPSSEEKYVEFLKYLRGIIEK